MERTVVEMPVEVTRKGYFAMWEEGGGFRNTGRATVIAGPKGERLKPIYIRTRGERACRQHALFVVKPGYYVVEAAHDRYGWSVAVWEIVELYKQATKHPYAIVRLVGAESSEGVEVPVPEKLREAVEAAQEKRQCYHCRWPHYVLEEGEDEAVGKMDSV